VRNCIRFVLALWLVLLVGSCTPSLQVKPGTEWSYEPNAIRVNLTADRDLNYYDRGPHTVVVWVYQLSNPNKFNQLADDQQGLTKLLEGGQFDPSVGDYKREFVQPGRSLTMTLDRAEGAKYVGLVVGYYALNRESAARLSPIPVAQVTQGTMVVSKPARIALDVHLGPQSIEKASVVPIEGQQPGRRY
jgi:type VI secretion system VasD/TssJ family lipoprotein